MRNFHAIVILVVAAVSGCRTTAPVDPINLYDLGEQLSRSVCPASAAQRTTVENRYVAGQVDHIEYRSCPEGSSEIYVSPLSSDPKGLAMSVEIKAPAVGLPHYLEIGAPVNGATSKLGTPESRSSEALNYSISQESPSYLIISVESGRITSVKWSYYVD